MKHVAPGVRGRNLKQKRDGFHVSIDGDGEKNASHGNWSRASDAANLNGDAARGNGRYIAARGAIAANREAGSIVGVDARRGVAKAVAHDAR